MRRAFNSIQATAVIGVIGVLLAFFIPRVEGLLRDSEVLAVTNSIRNISQNSYSLYLAKNSDLNISRALESDSIKTFEIVKESLNSVRLIKTNHSEIVLTSVVEDGLFHFYVEITSKSDNTLNEIAKKLNREITLNDKNISSISYKIDFEERIKKW